MDKFLESIIQAAKDAGAKDIDIAKICLDDLTKKIDEMDKLQEFILKMMIWLLIALQYQTNLDLHF